MSQNSETSNQMNQQSNSPNPPIDTLPNLKTNETALSNQLVGFAVNGFHPQLISLKENKEQIANKDLCEQSMMMTSKITQIVENCREEEEKEITKQKQMSLMQPNSTEQAWESDDDYDTDLSTEDADMITEITRSHTSLKNAFGDVFQHSAVPQLIASPGGRIVTWNNQFVTICGFTPASPPSSFTVFDLVEPKMMTDLFQVFLFALTDTDVIGKPSNINQEVEYQSITIPCRNFSTMPVPFHITLTLMYDVDPNKRCFHCILSPVTSIRSPLKEPLGKLHIVNQTSIMELL